MMFQKSTRKFACDKEKIFKIEACNGPILLHPKGGFQPKNHWAWTWDAASKQRTHSLFTSTYCRKGNIAFATDSTTHQIKEIAIDVASS